MRKLWAWFGRYDRVAALLTFGGVIGLIFVLRGPDDLFRLARAYPWWTGLAAGWIVLLALRLSWERDDWKYLP